MVDRSNNISVLQYTKHNRIVSIGCLFTLVCSFCAFVDYQKAFDTVWIKGLLYKLDKSDIFRTSKVFKIVGKVH